jgi:hypothetical protein
LGARLLQSLTCTVYRKNRTGDLELTLKSVDRGKIGQIHCSDSIQPQALEATIEMTIASCLDEEALSFEDYLLAIRLKDSAANSY